MRFEVDGSLAHEQTDAGCLAYPDLERRFALDVLPCAGGILADKNDSLRRIANLDPGPVVEFDAQPARWRYDNRFARNVCRRRHHYRNNNTNFRNYYDIYSTPVIYLLDEQKRIIAKRLDTDKVRDFIENEEKKEKAKK